MGNVLVGRGRESLVEDGQANQVFTQILEMTVRYLEAFLSKRRIMVFQEVLRKLEIIGRSVDGERRLEPADDVDLRDEGEALEACDLLLRD